MGKAITTLANFKVDPAIAVPNSEVVFLDEFIRVVGELDANIFGLEHRNVKIKILQVYGAEPCTPPGEDTVEEEFDKYKGGGVGADIAGKANPVATNGDTGSVRVILFRANFTDNHGMTDFLALVEGMSW